MLSQRCRYWEEGGDGDASMWIWSPGSIQSQVRGEEGDMTAGFVGLLKVEA